MDNASPLQSIIDLQIDRCDIVSSVGSIDVKPITVELNYFEDIFSNCVSGNLLINDSSSYQNLYSWCGNEYLILSFNRPGNPNPIRKVLRIYSISNRELTNNNNENYVLNFCSEELLINQGIRISKSYKNFRISDIVKDIAFKYLKIDPNEFPDTHIERTFGNYDIVIPNLKPLQAINWLCSLAISDSLPKNRESGATYMFWQTREGYFFRSILGILNNVGKSSEDFYPGLAGTGVYWYGTKNANLDTIIGNKDKSKSILDDRQQIISYKSLNSFDSLDNIRKGVFCNKVITLDYVTRTYRDSSFDYKKYFDEYLKTNIQNYKGQYNSVSMLSNFQDRLGKTQNQYSDTILKITPTNSSQPTNKFVSENQGAVKDLNLEYTIPYRTAQLGLLSLNRFKLVIPGDPNISVGKIIKIKIPQMLLDADKAIQFMDRFGSGLYLVTSVRHIINQNNDFKTVIEIRKDSYESDTTNINSSNPGPIEYDNYSLGNKRLKEKSSF
jgi:hypothetical protein